jgi:hypothetical protein
MDPDAFQRTADIAQQFEIIKAAPKEGIYTTEYAEQAIKALIAADWDVNGANYAPQTVEITKGGE